MFPTVQAHRQKLLAILLAALQAVNGRSRVREYLQAHPFNGAVYLISIGKAATQMAEGALECLGQRIARGLVITKSGHGKSWPGQPIVCLEAGHPFPDERSLAAGAALLDFIDATPREARFLFLISGGSSALVEVLPAGIEAADLARVNRWLLGAGLDIGRMNRVRKALSEIKGGRLAGRLGGRPALNLLISDVPGDDPRIIGSGLLVADNAENLQGLGLPAWIISLAQHSPSSPTPDAPCFKAIHTEIIAKLGDALHAAAHAAGQQGYAVHLHEEVLTGDAVALGRQLADQLIAGEPGLYIWGGESTVRLPPHPGRGGRNQALALAVASRIKNRADILLLAAASDGTDGPTQDAGAVVGGASLLRGEREGLDAMDCLTRADAGTFLESSGDLIHTGPTGTNVMDLALGLKLPKA